MNLYPQNSLVPVNDPEGLVDLLALKDAKLVLRIELDQSTANEELTGFIRAIRDELEAGGNSPQAYGKAVEDAAYLLRYCEELEVSLLAGRAPESGLLPLRVVVMAVSSKRSSQHAV